jgi:hypothetical protein
VTHPDTHKKKGILAILSELPVNSQNKPKKARPGTLTANSPKSHHNPLYRSFLTFKRRYKNCDFYQPKMSILGDNPRKIAKYSQIQIMTAIPNGYP